MPRRSASRWGFRFFGLTPADRETVLLEPTFLLMHHLGFTYADAMQLPVTYKRWFIERIIRERNESAENGHTSSRTMQANDPHVRAMQGKQRTDVPARLRHAG